MTRILFFFVVLLLHFLFVLTLDVTVLFALRAIVGNRPLLRAIVGSGLIYIQRNALYT